MRFDCRWQIVMIVVMLASPLQAQQPSRARQLRAGRKAGADGTIKQEETRPSFKVVEEAARKALQEMRGYRSGDLLDQQQIRSAVRQIEKIGWKIPDSDKLIQLALPANSFLVGQLRSTRGMRFMRKVSGDTTIFDRLDRISGEKGGPTTIRDLLKLPDAYRYAPKDPKGVVPNLVDLLPKQRSGRPRKIKDYDKPTGRIYTETQLIAKLKEIYDQDTKLASKSKSKSPGRGPAAKQSPQTGQIIINNTIGK